MTTYGTSTYARYLANIENLDGILSELQGITDIDRYQREIQEIKDEIANQRGNKFSVNYTLYNSRLEKIAEECNAKYTNPYDLSTMIEELESSIKEFSENNSKVMVEKAKVLIDKLLVCISKLDDNIEEKEMNIMNKAFEVLYAAILNESVIERTEILDYTLSKNNVLIKESLGAIIRKNVKNCLPKSVLNELKRVEGPGLDGLNNELLTELAAQALKEKRDGYVNRRKTALAEVLASRDELKRKRKEFREGKKDDRKSVANLTFTGTGLSLKLAACVLVPIAITVGSIIGAGELFKFNMGTKKNKVYNAETKKVISEEVVSYDTYIDKAYRATIQVCSPWYETKNIFGTKFYARDVTEYEYKSNEVVENLDAKDVIKSLKESDHKRETKGKLEGNDSTENPEIIVSEYTFDDIYETRWLAWIVMAIIDAAIIGSLCYCKDDEIKRYFKNTGYDISRSYWELKDTIIRIRNYKTERSEIDGVAVQFETLRNEQVKKYGDLINNEVDKPYTKNTVNQA